MPGSPASDSAANWVPWRPQSAGGYGVQHQRGGLRGQAGAGGEGEGEGEGEGGIGGGDEDLLSLVRVRQLPASLAAGAQAQQPDGFEAREAQARERVRAERAVCCSGACGLRALRGASAGLALGCGQAMLPVLGCHGIVA